MPLASSTPVFLRPPTRTLSVPSAALDSWQLRHPCHRPASSKALLSGSFGWRNPHQQELRLARARRGPLEGGAAAAAPDLEEATPTKPAAPAVSSPLRTAVTQLLLTSAAWGTLPVMTRMLFVSMMKQPSVWLCTALANSGAFLYLGSQVSAEHGARALWRCRRSIRGGHELAVWYFASAITFLLGLQLTSATEAAFIFQLCTLIVPVMQACQGAHVGRNVWVACILAFMGCVTLGSGGTSCGAISVQGIALLLASAFLFALHNVRLSAHAEACNTDLLAFWSKAAQAALGFVALPVAVCVGQCRDPREFISVAPLIDLVLVGLWVAWNSVVVKGLTAVWQAKAYKVIKPSEAEVVLATAPLFALGFAFLLLGEPFTAQTATGAGLFVTALVLAAKKSKAAAPNVRGANQTRGPQPVPAQA